MCFNSGVSLCKDVSGKDRVFEHFIITPPTSKGWLPRADTGIKGGDPSFNVLEKYFYLNYRD